MRKLLVIFLLLSLFVFDRIHAQTSDECFPVQYLDFFDLDESSSSQWSLSDLKAMSMDQTPDSLRGDRQDMWFLLPMLMRQVQLIYPDCNTSSDTAYENTLIRTYASLRGKPTNWPKPKRLKARLKAIRSDFTSLVEVDSLLPSLIFTTDDGPYQGKLLDTTADYTLHHVQETPFGKLSLTNLTTSTILTAWDKEDNVLWHRILKGAKGRVIKDAFYTAHGLVETDRGLKTYIYADGEVLRTYIALDASWIFYYHSW